MADATQGDLVQIHRVILEPGERPDTLPPCTRSLPYEGWVKGFLLNETANVGDEVTIRTFIGREMSGTLYQVNPAYDHTFGAAQETLLPIGEEARGLLEDSKVE